MGAGRWLTISGVYGYTDFQGDEFDNPALLGNPAVTEITSDNPIYVPTDNYSFSIAYSFGGKGDNGKFTPRLDYYGAEQDLLGHSHESHAEPDRYTEAQSCSQAYELLNARLEWASPEDTWRIALGMTNLHRRGVLLQQVRPHGVRPADARGPAGSSAGVVRAVHEKLQLIPVKLRVETGGAPGNERASFFQAISLRTMGVQMETLKDRVAFVTGGASGIGLGISKAMVAAGMRVVIADVREDHLKDARAWFVSQHLSRRVKCLKLDVTNRKAYARTADQAEKAFGKIHVLVNNAGLGLLGSHRQDEVRRLGLGSCR
jgi:hypothetical protein